MNTRQSLIEIAIVNSFAFGKEGNKELSDFWMNQAALIADNDPALLKFMEAVALINVVKSLKQ